MAGSSSARVGAIVVTHIEQQMSDTEQFRVPILRKSIGQIVTSFGGFLACCGAMYLGLSLSLWIVLPLSVLAAGFLVRIFIIQHDCGHGSFFRSRRANDMVGCLCSLITLTPYAFWRRQHARHHGSWNNLDRRALSGLDIYSSCMTVTEYRALKPWRKRLVRITSNPVVANLLLPPLVFILLYRVPFDTAKGWHRERRAVYETDFALAVLIAAFGLILGYGSVVAVQLPTMIVGSIIGVWLFSVQHRFEKAIWTPETRWDFATAVLQSTSRLHLPRVLQWFTGNIGFHHVHHADPGIPNYRLEECHNADGTFRSAPKLTLRTALHALRYTLWDEELGRMVPFRSR